MLNLLIAIISESFGKINGASEDAGYQEKARLISENNYLIPRSVKEAFSLKNHYLITVMEVNEGQKKKEEPKPVTEEKTTSGGGGVSADTIDTLKESIEQKISDSQSHINSKIAMLDSKLEKLIEKIANN